MLRKSGSDAPRGGGGVRLPLIALAAAAVCSGLLSTAMPSEGPASYLRLLSLLPVQLTALLWLWPRMR
jgi:hypothetical protein